MVTILPVLCLWTDIDGADMLLLCCLVICVYHARQDLESGSLHVEMKSFEMLTALGRCSMPTLKSQSNNLQSSPTLPKR